MHISIPQRVYTLLSDEENKLLNLRHMVQRTDSTVPASLLSIEDPDLDKLKAAFARIRDEHGLRTGALNNDIERWRKIVQNGGAADYRPRTLQQFADLLVEHLRTTTRQWVYIRQSTGKWLPYYVNYIEYAGARRRGHRDEAPPVVYVHLLFRSFNRTRSTFLSFHHQDANGRTVAETLAKKNVQFETDELERQYADAHTRWQEVSTRVGRQYLARGRGRSLDQRGNTTSLLQDGQPAKVVLDITFDQDGDRSGERTTSLHANFWTAARPKAMTDDYDDTLDLNDAVLEHGHDAPQPVQPQLPTHPFVPVYHLTRHERFEANTSELDDYIFDTTLAQHLVLPPTIKNLMDVLVSQGRVAFADLIDGKGSGACILLVGPPGVGKTLTAEIFAESTERPLLSVQAAELGTSPDAIEKHLRRVLRLGSRWNAVVLLDEAEVYVTARGADVHQNAIVAAFLRVLEHHTATIFMATNRVGQIDDAVASRCLARIDYAMPDPADQRCIWGVLNGLNGSGLSDAQMDEILKRHDNLSGRDIKQLLKLATLWSAGQPEPITPQTIDFVRAFLPTRPTASDDHEGPAAHA